MPEHGSQTIRRRRLAAELRRLRERAGLTGDEAADQLGWSASKISRIETHRIGVKPADLGRLLDLYHVGNDHRAAMEALARDARTSSRLESAAAAFPPEYATYLDAEAEASSLWIWDPLIIPGLLQTDSYARALMSGYGSMFKLPPSDAERRVEVRQIRREQLLNRDPPLVLSAIVDESALYRKFGDSAIMNEQLERLGEFSLLPNVTLRILPLDGDHPIGTGAFSYLQFPQVHEVPLNDLVEVEHLTRSYYLEDEEHTFKYRVTFEALAEAALGTEQSRTKISTAAQQRWA
jgi:transcriptional regulator with XRE-family HTH domain